LKNKFFQFKSYTTYWLDAIGEHSLHSPFFFNFYRDVVKTDALDPDTTYIEGIRNKLLSDENVISVTDLGVGSAHFGNSSRKIKDIARTSLSTAKYSNLYRRIIKHFNGKNIIELGTSLGINTLYLARALPCFVRTFEGAPGISTIASRLFREAGVDNIKLIEGNVDVTLPRELESVERVDFAFLDANHRLEPTLNYFDILATKAHHGSVIVLDDIHSSAEMEKAWRTIQNRADVFATADLFRCGMAFFDPSLNKQHVVLQF
jgi:predicted O-methyltransferase YrrM